jgi:hypothetical protein
MIFITVEFFPTDIALFRIHIGEKGKELRVALNMSKYRLKEVS